MVMEPVEPDSGNRPARSARSETADPVGGRDQVQPRRPLLMDPAGPRPSGFAPPSVLTPPAAPSAAPSGLPPGSAAATVVGLPATPSVLAPTATGSVLAPPAAHLPGTGMAGEASFGPVSQVVRISVRTLSSRIDLVLPDRSTIAETLETVLELAPRSLREQAIAHGGWILRTAAGDAIPGSSTLLDQGVVDGATLFLTGIDAADSAVVYDDVADAIASTVLTDPSVWPAGAGRAAALGAAGLFGGLACLSLLAAGPPWVVVAVILGAIAVLGQVAAGLLSRQVGDAGVAVLAGLLSVASGAAAATVATAGGARMLQIGAPQLLLGAAAAALLAAGAALLIGTRQVAFESIVTAMVLVFLTLACCGIFDLSPAEGAAIAAALALGLMPLVPTVALGLARFEVDPLPTTVDEVHADHETVDAAAVAGRTRQAVGHLTALIQGLTWPALVACVVLAISGDVTGQVLAALVGLGMLLRARLFVTVGQRLPLLVAGTGAIAALILALTTEFDGMTVVLATALPSLVAMIGCLLAAGRRRRVSPSVTRAAELIDMAIAVAVVPLVAGVLGLFGFIRGLGG
jgi:type VII secretion integral membrane protein EccD